jgi:type II secretory pathway component PulJ
VRAVARTLRGERGEMSITGLLVAMTLFALVSWGTVATFTRSETLNRTNQVRAEAQDTARRASDRLARELRNLAGPTPAQPQAVDRMAAQDLVFQVVRPVGPPPAGNPANVMRVRYCLDGAVLRRMEQPPTAFSSGVPSGSACDGSGWTNSAVLAADVTNGARAVFTYNSPVAAEVTAIHTDLWIDPDPGRGAAETTIASGVFLRNQNRRPVAVARAVKAGTGVLVLNGTLSYDPEGETLTYLWLRNGSPIPGATTPVYRLTGQTAGVAQSISVRVFDGAGLDATSAPVVVTP